MYNNKRMAQRVKQNKKASMMFCQDQNVNLNKCFLFPKKLRKMGEDAPLKDNVYLINTYLDISLECACETFANLVVKAQNVKY